MSKDDFREFGNLTVKGNTSILEKVTMSILGKNLTKGLSPLTHKITTSKASFKLTSKQMSDIKEQAKKLIFANSSIDATANKQKNDLMKPRIQIINSSKSLNHIHAVKVYPQGARA